MLYECVRALWRRRRLAALAIVASLCVAFSMFTVVRPTYESKAQVLFVPSLREPGIDGPTNPFLSLGGSVAIVASIVQAQVSDDATAAQLQQAGNTARYEVAPNLLENAGPVLLVNTSGTSKASSKSTLSAVIEAIKADLSTLQVNQEVRQEYRVTSVVLTSSAEPEVVRKAQVKATILALVVSLTLLTTLILLFERRRILASARKLARAQQRRGRPPGPPSSPSRRPQERREAPDRRPNDPGSGVRTPEEDPSRASPPPRATARTRG